LGSGVLAILLWNWFRTPSNDEPYFRGRSATYWAAAINAASWDDGAALAISSQKSWVTQLSISMGLRHKDEEVWDVLFGDDPCKIPVLIRLLQHQDPHIRRFAARGFEWPWPTARLPGAKAAIPVLNNALKDDYAYVRKYAAEALEQFGPAAREAVPALIESLEDDDEGVRKAAIHTLGEIGPEARDAVPALMKLLNSDDRRLRGNAASALGGIGPEAKAAVPYLLDLVKDESMNVRDSAYYALEKNDPQALAEAMRSKR
jgi:HEAT repeat protein